MKIDATAVSPSQFGTLEMTLVSISVAFHLGNFFLFADHIQLLMIRPRDPTRSCAGGPRASRSIATSQETASGASRASQSTPLTRGRSLSAAPLCLQQPRLGLRHARDMRRGGYSQAQRAFDPEPCCASAPLASRVACWHGLAAASSAGVCCRGAGVAGVGVRRVDEMRAGARHGTRAMPRDAHSSAVPDAGAWRQPDDHQSEFAFKSCILGGHTQHAASPRKAGIQVPAAQGRLVQSLGSLR